MRSFEQWMSEYGVSHQNPLNKKIHKVCVPVIMLSIIGLFWSITIPSFFTTIPYLNWATLFIAGCLIFYASLNLKMFLGMLIQTILMIYLTIQFEKTGSLLSISIILFIIAWIFQFYGHKIEGKKPSFMQDLAFLLIGPLWVQKAIFEKFNIRV